MSHIISDAYILPLGSFSISLWLSVERAKPAIIHRFCQQHIFVFFSFLCASAVFLLLFFCIMLFTDFNFKEGVLRGLNELGYEQPTPIQEQTITAFKTGKDIV